MFFFASVLHYLNSYQLKAPPRTVKWTSENFGVIEKEREKKEEEPLVISALLETVGGPNKMVPNKTHFFRI